MGAAQDTACRSTRLSPPPRRSPVGNRRRRCAHARRISPAPPAPPGGIDRSPRKPAKAAAAVDAGTASVVRCNRCASWSCRCSPRCWLPCQPHRVKKLPETTTRRRSCCRRTPSSRPPAHASAASRSNRARSSTSTTRARTTASTASPTGCTCARANPRSAPSCCSARRALPAPALEESERNLRQLDFLREPRVRPVRYHDGLVDVEVGTHDVWTLQLGPSFGRSGGAGESSFEIQDNNLFGFGKTLVIGVGKDVDRDQHLFQLARPECRRQPLARQHLLVGKQRRLCPQLRPVAAFLLPDDALRPAASAAAQSRWHNSRYMAGRALRQVRQPDAVRGPVRGLVAGPEGRVHTPLHAGSAPGREPLRAGRDRRDARAGARRSAAALPVPALRPDHRRIPQDHGTTTRSRAPRTSSSASTPR